MPKSTLHGSGEPDTGELAEDVLTILSGQGNPLQNTTEAGQTSTLGIPKSHLVIQHVILRPAVPWICQGPLVFGLRLANCERSSLLLLS